MLWVKSCCFTKIVFFLKNMVSLCLIRSVHSVFWPIKIFKIWREGVSVCFDRSRMIFDRSKLVNQLLKKGQIWTFSKFFSNSSFLFSLSALALGSTIHFLSFSFKIFARFLSLEAGKSLLSLFKFISWFHAFFMHYHGYFRNFHHIGVFDDSNLFLWNWSMGFCAMML